MFSRVHYYRVCQVRTEAPEYKVDLGTREIRDQLEHRVCRESLDHRLLSTCVLIICI